MLDKEEEGRLNLVLSILKADLRKDPEMYADEYKIKGILWLAEKLKELNEECREKHEFKSKHVG